MSKSFKKMKWFDDEDFTDRTRIKKQTDRRKDKRLKNALKTKDLRLLQDEND
jgi:hypothetical protein